MIDTVQVEAMNRRKAMVRQLKACTCLYPVKVYRNGSGHADDCPAHKIFTEARTNGR